MLGVAGLMAWESEDIRVAQMGERFEVGALRAASLQDVRGGRGAELLLDHGCR